MASLSGCSCAVSPSAPLGWRDCHGQYMYIAQLTPFATHVAGVSTAPSATTTSAASGLSSVGSLLSCLVSLDHVLGLACELNRDLTLRDGLAVHLVNGTLSFCWCRDIDKGVANGSVGARVGRDRHTLTAIVSDTSMLIVMKHT